MGTKAEEYHNSRMPRAIGYIIRSRIFREPKQRNIIIAECQGQ
jgi:hypothetical protein